jgi:hypothetical protein
MIIKRINESIVHVKFKTQRELTETLLRFQEHYESPKFRNKIFTLGEYRKYYCDRFGSFTYYDDNAGFNFPSITLKAFYDGLFDPLTDKEKKFLESFQNRTDDFYVIGTYCDNDAEEDYIDHELTHALFSTNKTYKKEVEKILKHIDLRRTIKGLKRIGYHEEVCFDETQAYMATGVEIFVEHKIWYSIDKVDDLRKLANKHLKRLKANQRKYFDI